MVALTHGHEVWWARVPGARRLLRRIGDSVDVMTYVSEWCRERIAPALSPGGRGAHASGSRRVWTPSGSTRAAGEPRCGAGWGSRRTRRWWCARPGWSGARAGHPGEGLAAGAGGPTRTRGCCSWATGPTGARSSGWSARRGLGLGASSPGACRGRRCRRTSTPGTCSRCPAGPGGSGWSRRRSGSCSSRPPACGLPRRRGGAVGRAAGGRSRRAGGGGGWELLAAPDTATRPRRAETASAAGAAACGSEPAGRRGRRARGRETDIWLSISSQVRLKRSLTSSPSAKTRTMITAAIAAAMRPYSTERRPALGAATAVRGHRCLQASPGAGRTPNGRLGERCRLSPRSASPSAGGGDRRALADARRRSSLKTPCTTPPRAKTMMTMIAAIAATSRPYSTAEAPVSSLR